MTDRRSLFKLLGAAIALSACQIQWGERLEPDANAINGGVVTYYDAFLIYDERGPQGAYWRVACWGLVDVGWSDLEWGSR